MNTLNVIFTADDLGLSKGINAGITEAAQNGLLSSTCLRVNGPAYNDAIQNFIPRFPQIGIGVHLNIVEGKSFRTDLADSLICEPDGTFRHNFIGLLRQRRNREFLAEVEAEFRDQIDRILVDVPEIDHFNTHQHSHAIPEIFELTCRLAKEYGVPFVRLQKETFYKAGALHQHLHTWYPVNLVKWFLLKGFARKNSETATRYGVQTNDGFVGILYTGFMTSDTVINGLRKFDDGQTVEVLLHPSIPGGEKEEIFLNKQLRDYLTCFERLDELAALVSQELRQRLTGWAQITNYRAIANSQPPLHDLLDTDLAAQQQMLQNASLRTLVIIDETPFFHPEMLSHLINRMPEINIVEVAAVTFPSGVPIQKYLLRNFALLKAREYLILGASSWLKKLWGIAPKILRGDHEASVRAVCKRHNVPCSIVQSVNDEAFLDRIEKANIDLVLSSNSLIFHERLLSLPKFGCLNRHSGLLPAYGGILPVFRAIQNSERHTGVSVHSMVREIDQGNTLSRKWVPIFPGDTLTVLYRMCFFMSVLAFEEAVRKVIEGQHGVSLPDEGLEPSYYSYPHPDDWREFRENGGRFA